MALPVALQRRIRASKHDDESSSLSASDSWSSASLEYTRHSNNISDREDDSVNEDGDVDGLENEDEDDAVGSGNEEVKKMVSDENIDHDHRYDKFDDAEE